MSILAVGFSPVYIFAISDLTQEEMTSAKQSRTGLALSAFAKSSKMSMPMPNQALESGSYARRSSWLGKKARTMYCGVMESVSETH